MADTLDRSNPDGKRKRGRLAVKPVGKKFFIGTTEWALTPKQPMQTVFEYCKFVLGAGYGAYQQYEHAQPRTYVPPVLVHMFAAILNFNQVLTSSVWQFVCVEDGYPDRMAYDHETHVFFIAVSSIVEFLARAECTPKLQFVFDCEFVPASSYGQVPSLSLRTLARLFVIADHCATHFLETLEFGSTDLYCHSNFGRGNFMTLGSRLDIKTVSSLTPTQRRANEFVVTTSYTPVTAKHYGSVSDSNNYLVVQGLDPFMPVTIST